MGGDSAPIVLGIGLATGAATIFGGVLVMRFRAALGLLVGFSAGAVLGVALFDLLPEAMTLGRGVQPPLAITLAMAAGFMVYLAADRALSAFSGPLAGARGHLGPASLTAHSLLDGLSVGLAFDVSSTAGWLVAIAVLAHDLLDGANTVALSLTGGAPPRIARRWLAADALAPLGGLVIAHFMPVSTPVLALLLATFAGGFLYIAIHELLPQAEATAPRRALGLMAVGLLFIYAAVVWARP